MRAGPLPRARSERCCGCGWLRLGRGSEPLRWRLPLQTRRAEREQQRLLAVLDEERRGDLGFVMELPSRGHSASSKQGLPQGAAGRRGSEELGLQGGSQGPAGLAPQVLLVLATEDPATPR